MVRISLIPIFLFFSLCSSFILPFMQTADLKPFNWTGINPSWDLEYHDCYGQFRCARLLVPLDWQNLQNNNTVALAITTLPAKVRISDPSFGGTIIINPGGPGASGTEFLAKAGPFMQRTVDSSKHYEILSFDPRGILHTTPGSDCFQDTFSRNVWELQKNAIGNIGTSDAATFARLSAARAFGMFCQSPNDGVYDNGDNIREFSSTASVARDMLEIVNKVDELLEKETSSKDHFYQQRLARSLPRLQFWGLSYGTHLGNTFVSMYPERTGKMIMDGVVDSDAYTNFEWVDSLHDAEHVVDFFYQSCFEATSSCPLFKHHDNSPQDIRDRVDALFDKVARSPVPIVDGDSFAVITTSDLQDAYFGAWYFPVPLFPPLAKLVANMIEGNYSQLMKEMPLVNRQESCSAGGGGPSLMPVTIDATPMVLCGDGIDIRNETVEYLQYYADELLKLSPAMGSKWSELALQCMGWTFRPQWRFTGPFESPEPGLASGIGPSSPLLFLSSRYDPVTPLKNAYAMSSTHPKSAVVYQNSFGHSSIFAAPSNCTTMIIKEYFAEGKVPANNTFCEIEECDPWIGCPGYRVA